ncbi:hypothetical protein [Psychromonas aquimarina]|uniref:hypothetical protein n=1 Tax=Psychromonas aquimarina TaxID=444919 RepID=UPI00042A87B0|nr:hypothetical protein [Psychromonas aquimarina]
MKKIFCFILLLILQGCSSYNLPSDFDTDKAATIIGSYNNGSVAFEAVNGQTLDYDHFPYQQAINIEPGTHVFDLSYYRYSNRGTSTASAKVTAFIESGKNYSAHIKLQGGDILFFIKEIDSGNEIASASSV